MTEIKAEEGTINGHIVLGDFIIGDRELENLYAYLEEKRHDREQELMEVARKAVQMEAGQARLSRYYGRLQEQLEARNRDLDRLAGILEKV